MPTPESRPKSWHCPKCGTLLEQDGVLTADGVECPTFQCENPACAGVWKFDGAEFPVAFTFAIMPDGRPFIPPDDESRI